MAARRRRRSGIGILLRRLILTVLGLLLAYLGGTALLLLVYTSATPPITGVQLQRMAEAWISGETPARDYRPVPPEALPPTLTHAVVAAEDGRFFEHRGVDWEAIDEARREDRERLRGGSSITQQLVKNLFLTTHRSYLRKALEVPLAYLAEFILSKERIVYLYLTVIEWGPDIYGAEAAAQYHYGLRAEALTRYQAATLAACIPNPRERTPERMGWYTNIILQRMTQHGW